jgi:FixJ family two-component response regulator
MTAIHLRSLIYKVAAQELSLAYARRVVPLRHVPVISIIDDDASVGLATSRLVRSLGYVAHTFASASEFLQSSDVNNASCVIADVQMPGMSGIELQRALTALGHSVPVIFITAFPEERTRAYALKAGAVGFLSKPFNCSLLIDCIDTALKRHEG